MNKELALEALERAELLADHRSTTRDSYRTVIADYLSMIEGKRVTDFLSHRECLAIFERLERVPSLQPRPPLALLPGQRPWPPVDMTDA